MQKLRIISRIDGQPVAWQCADCLYIFSFPSGRITAEERRRKLAQEFRTHVKQVHKPSDQGGLQKTEDQVLS